MRIVPFGAGVDVARGEVFAVEREDHAASGYSVRVEAPTGVSHLGTDLKPAAGFGGAGLVLERFRCERAGDHRLVFVEARPWESAGERSVVTVHCR